MIEKTDNGVSVILVTRFLFSILVLGLCVFAVLFLYVWLLKDGRTHNEKLEDRFTNFWNEEQNHDTCNTMFATDQERLKEAVDKAYFAHSELRTASLFDLEETSDYLEKYKLRIVLPDFWLENFDKGLEDLWDARYAADRVFKTYIDMEVAVECEKLNAPLTNLSREAIRSQVLDTVQRFPLNYYFHGFEYGSNVTFYVEKIRQELENKQTWAKKVGVYFCQRLQEAGGNNTSCPAEQW